MEKTKPRAAWSSPVPAGETVEKRLPDGVFAAMATTRAARQLTDVVPSRAAARLRAFRREVDQALPGKVARVVLFGSRARGDAKHDSDYDVAVFVRDLTGRRSIDHALADTAYRHILAGFHIRPFSVPAEFLDSDSPGTLARNIARDGIAVP
ncbi:nucleotidyltransferase domain-containing protein [Azospirillum picis]|uniref:Polymerase nucleotidyl transferase domain-containing protein n=1 Tax=Azospirillum picis TaxID=488438 RepID=A0ABU0MVL2_9PROT|nr:nucleotidyltransferase domain-containing protein [Azospirillum picis]MBP2301876.1 hypothetical protein [Azospirillum picis]MDQ0537228.1 hypothetical protein [Azospirillum picis]